MAPKQMSERENVIGSVLDRSKMNAGTQLDLGSCQQVAIFDARILSTAGSVT
jgi:hypothetical protein